MGPLPVAGSISPDVNDPAFRAVSFDQLRQTYFDEAKALLEGGVDLLIVETIFDTLNGKAALFAITDALEKTGRNVPLMISGTVIDKSGRNLSGQTVEASLISIGHAEPLIFGLNCSLGPDEMEPFVEELARVSPVLHECVSECGSAGSAVADRLSGDSRDFCTQGREVGRERLAERGRRLLRHDAGAHPSADETGA